jgi:hypothetical protein
MKPAPGNHYLHSQRGIMARLFGNESLKEYQRYMKIARNLNHKIIDAYLNEMIIKKAAIMLGLWQRHLLILDSEDDLSVLMDFALYEVPQEGGKNCVERYAEEIGGINAIERDLLAAMVKAQTGLFKVRQILRDKRQIMLDDLISSGDTIILTDINFSQTLIDELVLFIRPIRTTKFTMTSGIAFVFPGELEKELTLRWKRLEWKGSAERYAWFFRQSKKRGFETMYM